MNCLLRDTVQAVVQDLTQTLTKDIKKRMCETLGFYLFEKWWQEQETKYKEKVHIIIFPINDSDLAIDAFHFFKLLNLSNFLMKFFDEYF